MKRIICLLAVCAGSAQAQISYTLTDVGTELTASNFFDADGQFSVTPGFDMGANFTMNRHRYLLDDYTSIPNSFSFDAASFPSINSFETVNDVAGQASAERFEIGWNVASAASFPTSVDPDMEFGSFQLTGALGGQLTFTEDTTIRISYEGIASGLVGEGLAGGGINNFAKFEFYGSAIQNPFSAGFGTAVDITNAFSVEIDVLAGSQLFVEYQIESTQFSSAVLAGGLREWDQASSGSMSIEVIPAPASGSLLALAGLAAARRRR